MAPINRAGPALLHEMSPPVPLSVGEVARRRSEGEWVVDARSRVPFARAHIPGSLNVELADAFASYVGWLVPFDAALVLVLPGPEDEALGEATTQLLRIGYDRVGGYLHGGIDTWIAAGNDVASYPVAGLDELCLAYRSGRPRILDVRQQIEWNKGSIPGSRHVFVGDLPDRLDEVDGEAEVWAICASGQRSSMAASILDRVGVPVRMVDGGGVKEFLQECAPNGERRAGDESIRR
jgi:rhodanese-related sulfurtransferase